MNITLGVERRPETDYLPVEMAADFKSIGSNSFN